MLKLKPVMGWNSWNTFGEQINEKLIMEMADKFIELGYKACGYEYIIIDDCWSEKQRDENNRLVADKKKFPHGIKYLSDYIHSRGLKFGMYADCGFWTCAGYPGSYGYEYIDAETFADWDVDYLKYDYGYIPQSADTKNAYLTMAQAIRATGKDIILAACNWGVKEPWNWMRSHGADTYRSTRDIFESRESILNIFKSQCENLENSAAGCYNDLDMLVVGMGGQGNVSRENGCTYEDYEMHFAMWAFLGSPLIIGADIRNLDEKCSKLLQNKELIKINQDPENRPPFRITNYGGYGYTLCRLLENGEMAIFVINLGVYYAPVMISFDDLGIRSNQGYKVQLTNILTGETTEPLSGGFCDRPNANEYRIYRARIIK